MSKNIEEMVTTGGALASHSPSDASQNIGSPPMPKIPCPDGVFMGKPYFNCDSDTFAKIRMGRKKKQRWSTFLGTKNDWAEGVRRWARKSGNPDFLFRNASDGTFVYAQKGIWIKENTTPRAAFQTILATYKSRGYTEASDVKTATDERGREATVLSKPTSTGKKTYVFITQDGMKTLGNKLSDAPKGWKIKKGRAKKVLGQKTNQPDLGRMWNLLSQSYKNGGPLADHTTPLENYLASLGIKRTRFRTWLNKLAKYRGERDWEKLLIRMEDDFYTL